MKKITTLILNASWGCLLGYVSAWVVWMMIYGVGSRVISDPQHYELTDSVHLAGIIVGAALGLAVGAVSRWPPLVIFAAHFTAGVMFTVHNLFSECYGILRITSWRSGLAIHWTMLITVCAALAWAFRKDKTRRPTKPSNVTSKPAPGAGSSRFKFDDSRGYR